MNLSTITGTIIYREGEIKLYYSCIRIDLSAWIFYSEFTLYKEVLLIGEKAFLQTTQSEGGSDNSSAMAEFLAQRVVCVV